MSLVLGMIVNATCLLRNTPFTQLHVGSLFKYLPLREYCVDMSTGTRWSWMLSHQPIPWRINWRSSSMNLMSKIDWLLRWGCFSGEVRHAAYSVNFLISGTINEPIQPLKPLDCFKFLKFLGSIVDIYVEFRWRKIITSGLQSGLGQSVRRTHWITLIDPISGWQGFKLCFNLILYSLLRWDLFCDEFHSLKGRSADSLWIHCAVRGVMGGEWRMKLQWGSAGSSNFQMKGYFVELYSILKVGWSIEADHRHVICQAPHFIPFLKPLNFGHLCPKSLSNGTAVKFRP
jgi:hypothetical protein